MQVFVSHHSEESLIAGHLEASLQSEGHEVFRRGGSLPSGPTENQQVRQAINSSDLFIFLLSSAALADGSQALADLTVARHRWKSPKHHILPVVASPVPESSVPAYLSTLEPLAPEGEIVSEISYAVFRMRQSSKKRRNLLRLAAGAAALVLLVGAVKLGISFIPLPITRTIIGAAPEFQLRGGEDGQTLAWGGEAVFELVKVPPDADFPYTCEVRQPKNSNIASVEHDAKCKQITIEAARRPFVEADGTPYEIGFTHPENDWLPLLVFDESGREIWRSRIPLMMMNMAFGEFEFHGLPLDPDWDHSVLTQHLLTAGEEHAFEIRSSGRPLPEGFECRYQAIDEVAGLPKEMSQILAGLPGFAPPDVREKQGVCAFTIRASGKSSERLMPPMFKLLYPETGFQADLPLHARIR